MATRRFGLSLPARIRALTLALVVLALIAAAALAPIRPGRAISTVDAEERHALELINEERAAHGLAPLAFSVSLQAAAAWMSLDQARDAEIRHDDSLGRGLRPRLSDFGYPNNTSIWENVAVGSNLDGADVVPLWIDSPPHHDDILAPSARAAGLARAQVDGGRWYWTLDLGSTLSDADRLNLASAEPQPASPTWALIGWPAADQDVVTAAADHGWTSAVFSWDPVATTFDDYFRELPSSLHTLQTLRTGHAYWVQLDEDATAPLPPTGGLLETIQLDPGLNLVSWLGSPGVTLAEAAASAGPGLVTAWAWDFESQSYVVYSPLLLPALASHQLSTGRGLWVNVDRSVDWHQIPRAPRSTQFILQELAHLSDDAGPLPGEVIRLADRHHCYQEDDDRGEASQNDVFHEGPPYLYDRPAIRRT